MFVRAPAAFQTEVHSHVFGFEALICFRQQFRTPFVRHLHVVSTWCSINVSALAQARPLRRDRSRPNLVQPIVRGYSSRVTLDKSLTFGPTYSATPQSPRGAPWDVSPFSAANSFVLRLDSSVITDVSDPRSSGGFTRPRVVIPYRRFGTLRCIKSPERRFHSHRGGSLKWRITGVWPVCLPPVALRCYRTFLRPCRYSTRRRATRSECGYSASWHIREKQSGRALS
jgi:hypothetical protein